MSDRPVLVQVAVQTPAHSAVGDLLSYTSERPLPPGTLVRVPLGTREVLGVVWDGDEATGELPAGAALKPVAGVLDGVAPLGAAWRDLVAFAARYYQRSLGEIALAALPPQLRDLRPDAAGAAAQAPAAGRGQHRRRYRHAMALTAEQTSAGARIAAETGPFLLFGSTGSGKTEVYLRSVRRLLARDADGAGAGDGAGDQPHAPARGALQALRAALRRRERWCRCTAA